MRTIFTLIWGLGDSHTLRESESSHPTSGNLSFSRETFFFFLFQSLQQTMMDGDFS